MHTDKNHAHGLKYKTIFNHYSQTYLFLVSQSFFFCHSIYRIVLAGNRLEPFPNKYVFFLWLWTRSSSGSLGNTDKIWLYFVSSALLISRFFSGTLSFAKEFNILDGRMFSNSNVTVSYTDFSYSSVFRLSSSNILLFLNSTLLTISSFSN